MKNTLKRFKKISLRGIIISLTVISMVISQPLSVFAAPTTNPPGGGTAPADTASQGDLITSYLYYQAVARCFSQGTLNNKMDVGDASSFKWFTDGDTYVGHYIGGKDSDSLGCKDSSWIQTAFGIWKIDPIDALCTAGLIRDSQVASQDTKISACINGSGAFFRGASGDTANAEATALKTFISSVYYKGEKPELRDDMKYALDFANFTLGCQADMVATVTSATTSDKAKGSDTSYGYTVNAISGSGASAVSTPTIYYSTSKKFDHNSSITLRTTDDYKKGTQTCIQLANEINSTAAAQLQYIRKSGDTTGDTHGGSGTPTAVCNVGGFSFMICPAINAMADVTNWIAQLLQQLLIIQPLPLNDAKAPIFVGWSSILTVANIVLLLVFMAVIIAQVTSAGISNYGVKKMLPKLIAAAILMNLSYYFCALAVDLSNLIGSGVAAMLSTLISGNSFSSPSSGNSLLSGNSAIAEVAAGVGMGALLIFFFLMPALLAAFAVLFTLAARIAILVLLIIVAPLAFAAWVLPNTEKYFKKWYDLFIAMLVLYPMVMAVFAASAVASTLIQGVALR